MNRCYSPALLTVALCAALPLYAAEPAPDSADRSPTELAAVRVQARQPAADTAQSTSFGAGDWKSTPASVTRLDRTQIERRHLRTLSEIATQDASLGDSYAPVGYYQNIAIRGFALDTATGYRFNGLPIAGEQRLALENVQTVEILKGEAGLAAGVMSPGGIINYVGKRAADVRTATLGTDAEGSRYAAVDVGQWLTPRFGVRVNAAWEDTASYIDHADGRRNFYSVAADWLIGERGKLEVDANYQTSAQRSASGYQLLGATVLPRGVDRSRMLGHQAWQQPVGIDSTNITALHTYDFSPDWQSRVSVSHSRTVIDDNVAFAYGCYYAASCADGSVPGNYFGPDGAYDIYDYRSPDDTRRNQAARAELRGTLRTGRVEHALTFGAETFRRTVDKRRNVNEYVGTANINDAQVPQFAPSPRQPAPRRAAWTAGRMRCSRWTGCALATTGNGWRVAASYVSTSAPTARPASPNATAGCRASCRRPRWCGRPPTRSVRTPATSVASRWARKPPSGPAMTAPSLHRCCRARSRWASNLPPPMR